MFRDNCLSGGLKSGDEFELLRCLARRQPFLDHDFGDRFLRARQKAHRQGKQLERNVDAFNVAKNAHVFNVANLASENRLDFVAFRLEERRVDFAQLVLKWNLSLNLEMRRNERVVLFGRVAHKSLLARAGKGAGQVQTGFELVTGVKLALVNIRANSILPLVVAIFAAAFEASLGIQTVFIHSAANRQALIYILNC